MPFTVDQFFDVFEAYNRGTAPAAILLWILASAAALPVIFKRFWAYKFALILLSIVWAWSGAVYQFIFFAAINPAARVFGIAFILEALLLLWLAFHGPGWERPPAFGTIDVGAIALAVYALLVYPFINSLFGHVFPRTPTFGAPCPVTIFTLAVLILVRAPIYAAIVPLLWALIGSSAAFFFGIYADLALIVAALLFALSWSGRFQRHV